MKKSLSATHLQESPEEVTTPYLVFGQGSQLHLPLGHSLLISINWTGS